MNGEEWSQLMLIYGAGFIGVYVIFALLYLHAYRLRDALELTRDGGVRDARRGAGARW